MLSISVCPKVITLSGFHCIIKLLIFNNKTEPSPDVRAEVCFGQGTNFENINFNRRKISASTRFWGLQVTNIDTQKRLTSTPLKLGINIKIKVVTNIDRDCNPSRNLLGYPVPPTL